MSTLSSVEARNTWDRRRIGGILAPIVIGFIVAAIVLALGDLSIFHWLRGDAVQFDATVRAAVHVEASPPLTKTLEAIGLLGKWPLPAFAIALCILLWRRGRKDLAVYPLAALAAAVVLLEITKELVRRVRPHAFFALHTPASWSFPSGHTLASTTCYLVFAALLLALIRSRLSRGVIVFLGIALPLTIGFARVYLGVHWPTDVIAGWAAGFCLATGFIASHRKVAGRGAPAQLQAAQPLRR